MREATLATPNVHLWPASACLISELAEELAALERPLLAQSLVVLPTKRLGNWLLALLAQKLGAFLPPRIHTLDEMLAQYAPTIPESQLRLLTTLEDQQLVADLIETGNFRHLRPGHEHEICQLFKELIDWQLDDVAFSRLEQAARSSAHSEPGLNTLTERIAELQELHARRAKRLAQAQAIPNNVIIQARCKSLAQALHEQQSIPGINGLIYVVGLSSAKALHEPLFRALSHCPRAQLWFNDPAIGLRRGPLERLLEFVENSAVKHATSTKASPQMQINTIAASSPLSEAALAVELVASAISQGCMPSHIALLVADDHSYAAPIRYLMAQTGIKANFAITAPLAQTRLGSWLAALVACLQAPDEHLTLLALLAHPVSVAWFLRNIADLSSTGSKTIHAMLGYGAFNKPWCLSTILRQDPSAPTADDSLAANQSMATYALCLRAVADLLRPLVHHKKRPIDEHLVAWRQVISQVAAVVAADAHDDATAMGLSESVNAAISEFFAELDTCNNRLVGHLTSMRFVQIVTENLLQRDVRPVGDQLAGVQVLSIEEARYVPFRLAIILGCNEGRLPRALPKDRLIDNYLKTQAGLPGWQLLEAIEDTTFRLLAARLPHLCLTYAESDGKDELVRSRFIETLLAEGKAQVLTADAEQALSRLIDGKINSASQQIPCESDRQEGQLSPPESDLTSRLQRMSATSLEALLRCPYQYLLRHLQVEKLEFKDDQKAKDEGELLHTILEGLFSDNSPDIEPLPDGQAWPDFPVRITRRLLDLTRQIAPADFVHTSLYRHLRGFAWPAFAQHLHRIYTPNTWDTMLGKPWRELRFGGHASPVVTAAINGRQITLSGAIDAVDPVFGMTIVTDFKRRSLPDTQLARQGLAPQLILYAHALEQLKLDLPEDDFKTANLLIGYWSIQLGTWSGIAAGKNILASAKQLGLIGARTKTTLEDMMSLMFEHWRWRDQQIVQDERAFRADPSACGFCSFDGICRKDDPRWASTMAQRALLKKRISAIAEE